MGQAYRYQRDETTGLQTEAMSIDEGFRSMFWQPPLGPTQKVSDEARRIEVDKTRERIRFEEESEDRVIIVIEEIPKQEKE